MTDLNDTEQRELNVIKEKIKKVNAEADALSKVYIAVNAALQDLGMEIWDESNYFVPGQGDERLALGYAHASGHWQLAVKPVSAAPVVTPLLSAPRNVRLEARKHLSRLVEKITRTLDSSLRIPE